jgi:opacity protein-like surface antigen
MKCSGVTFLSLVFAMAAASPIYAQTDAQPANPQPANAQQQNAQSDNSQIDVSGSFYRAFNRSTAGHGTKQTPEDSNGGMFEARYLASRYVGFGLAISFNPSNQSFTQDPTTCGLTCPPYPPTTVTARAIEVVPEYVPSWQFGRVRAFAVGGLGFHILSTSAPPNQFASTNRTRIVYVFGGGADFSLTPRFGVRVQYRYGLYKAPDISTPGGYPATGKYTSTSEPMAGVFYTF